MNSQREQIHGVMYMVLAAFFFCLMGIFVRLLLVDQQESAFFTCWVRFVIGAFVMWIPTFFGVWSLRVHNKPVFLMRGVFGASGMLVLYIAIENIGMGRGTVLIYLMGVIGAISGVFILKEKLRPAMIVAIVLGLAGFLMSCQAGIPNGMEWLAVLGAVSCGITLSLIRLLRQTDNSQVAFFSQGLFGSLILLPFLYDAKIPISLLSWIYIVAATLMDIVGQLCMNAGLGRLPVAQSGAFMMLSPIFSLIAGLILFQEYMTWIQWTGCLLVLLAATLGLTPQRKS